MIASWGYGAEGIKERTHLRKPTKVSESMAEVASISRWSASELESRIKGALWAKALNADDEEAASIGFAEARRFLEEPDRSLSDKTLAACLKAMVRKGILSKVKRDGRQRYLLSFSPTEQDIERAVLAADVKRLEFAGQWGVRGGLEDGYTVYGVGDHSSRAFRLGLRVLCEKATKRLERLIDAELQAIMVDVERALTPALTRRERFEVREFLFAAFVMEMATQPSSQGIALATHLEKVFGPEFFPPYAEILNDFSIGEARRHPRIVKRFIDSLEKVLKSPNPRQEAAGALLAFHETMSLDQMEGCKRELRRGRIPVVRLLALGKRISYLRRALGLAIVVTPKMIPKVAPAEFAKSLKVGRAERTDRPIA